MLNTFPLVITLPLSEDEISKYMGDFDKLDFSLDYANTRKNMSNEQILNYISNCDIKNIRIINFELNDDFMDLLIQYVKFDRELDIPVLSEHWNAILAIKQAYYTVPEYQEFMDTFKLKYSKYIEEINSFFYSVHKMLCNVIVPSDKDLEEEIKSSDNRKLELVGPNVVSISKNSRFWSYIGMLKMDKMYVFDEFINPIMNGNTLVSYFLSDCTPYKAMYSYNKLIVDPGYREEVQKELNIIREEKLKTVKESNKEEKKEDIDI